MAVLASKLLILKSLLTIISILNRFAVTVVDHAVRTGVSVSGQVNSVLSVVIFQRQEVRACVGIV